VFVPAELALVVLVLVVLVLVVLGLGGTAAGAAVEVSGAAVDAPDSLLSADLPDAGADFAPLFLKSVTYQPDPLS
jgi:hypothetical protein